MNTGVRGITKSLASDRWNCYHIIEHQTPWSVLLAFAPTVTSRTDFFKFIIPSFMIQVLQCKPTNTHIS